MKRTLLLLLAGLTLSTTACGRLADQAMLLIEDDGTTLEANDGNVTVESDKATLGHAKPGAPAAGTRVDTAGAKVVVNDDDAKVRVDTDTTKVRTGGGNVDVDGNDGKKGVKVRNDGDGTRVEVGGVKVDGAKVTVPGVGTVNGY